MLLKSIKCAIAGLGRIASSLEDDPLREKPATHAGAIDYNPNTILIAGADPDEDKQIRFSKRWNCPAIFDNTSTMLQKHKVDILHIASPPSSHLSIVKESLKNKPKLIICEKPLADSLDNAQAVVNLCQENGIILMTNYERRYSKDYLYAKKCIQDKKYGELLSINAQVFMGQKRKAAETLWDDGTHMLDIVRFLSSSDFTHLSASGTPFETGGKIHILGELGSVDFHMEVAGKRDYLTFELQLSFESGSIRIGNGVFEEYKSKESPYYKNFRSLSPVKHPNFNTTNYFSGMLDDAVLVLKGDKNSPSATGKDGLASIKAMHEILEQFR